MSDTVAILNQLLDERGEEIEEWFDAAFGKTVPFFYNSVDLRHSGHKLVPVDTNLFPGGFNNLAKDERSRAAQEAKIYFDRYYADVASIVLVAEDHTRNLYYLEHLAVLVDILQGAGKKVMFSSFAVTEQGEELELESLSGRKLNFFPMEVRGNSLTVGKDFVPDLVLVNNDLSKGLPEILEGIDQAVVPPIGFGWYRRRKTSHFDTYRRVADDFCRNFSVDLWLINALFHKLSMAPLAAKKIATL